MKTLLPRYLKVFEKHSQSLILTVEPQPMRFAPPVIVPINHDLARVPSFLFMMRFAATDRLLNLAHVESHFFARAMLLPLCKLQCQSNLLFIIIFMTLSVICFLARTWRW